MENDEAEVKRRMSTSVVLKSSTRKSVDYRAKRTVSFRDKDPNQKLHTIHHVESYKTYNAVQDKGWSCLKCQIL
ncbi:hypothetical protein SteCoe_34609 [Stentor coeruleus]|uniref:Uncharacterized protein n=1 Tax=Stentor coeruleus TaxID=5963 RepID=A0A1R2AUA5_9CILI|nr:hypothetical protein SteCoe_34609 [Stentor coeruleus]